MTNLDPPSPLSHLRITRQRKAILEEVQRLGGHPTVEQVFEGVRLRLPTISLGTVYRNLKLLSEAGALRELVLSGGQKRYDLKLEKHYHLCCVRCGAIIDVPTEPFGDMEARVRQVTGWEVMAHSLEFSGLCRTCQQGRSAGS